MYFSRVCFRANLSVGEIARAQCQNPYQAHQQLWTLFADDPTAQRDFLFRAEPDFFYLVSQRAPNDWQGIWQIEVKRYEPKLFAGRNYRFILRVNPIVTRRDDQGKARRHDIVMDAKQKIGYSGLSLHDKPSLSKITSEAGVAWLQSREAQYGFATNKTVLQVDRYQQHRMTKRGKAKPIRYSTLDFSGILQVTDPTKLCHALQTGIGPAKAFGCGLLSLARM